MKKICSLFMILGALAFTSCDSATRLAKDILGTWAGTPEKLQDPAAASSTIIETYIFTSGADNPDEKSGNITITGNVSTTIPMTSRPEAIQPTSLSAAASTSVSGTWKAIDDDEIILDLDPKSIQVKVDPQAVVVMNDIITDTDTPMLDSIRTQVTEGIRAQIQKDLQMRYLAVRRLDDVKVKGPLLKFEIADTDYVLTRQGSVE